MFTSTHTHTKVWAVQKCYVLKCDTRFDMFVLTADCTTTAATSAATTQNQPPAATDPGKSLYIQCVRPLTLDKNTCLRLMSFVMSQCGRLVTVTVGLHDNQSFGPPISNQPPSTNRKRSAMMSCVQTCKVFFLSNQKLATQVIQDVLYLYHFCERFREMTCWSIEHLKVSYVHSSRLFFSVFCLIEKSDSFKNIYIFKGCHCSMHCYSILTLNAQMKSLVCKLTRKK